MDTNLIKSFIEKTVKDELQLRTYIKTFRIQHYKKLYALLVEMHNKPETMQHTKLNMFLEEEKKLNQKVMQYLQESLIDKEKITSSLKGLSMEQKRYILKFWTEAIDRIYQIERA